MNTHNKWSAMAAMVLAAGVLVGGIVTANPTYVAVAVGILVVGGLTVALISRTE
jgi:hypothetical protein